MFNCQYCRCVLSVGGNQFLKMADVILDKNQNKINLKFAVNNYD